MQKTAYEMRISDCSSDVYSSDLSSLVVEAMIDAGRLVALPIDLAPRPFLALRHKERYRSRAADAFTAMLDQDTHLRNRGTSASSPPGCGRNDAGESRSARR